MNTFPLFFKLENQPIAIIGGGEVALRKADLLRRAGACLTIVAPIISEDLQALLSNDINTINDKATNNQPNHQLIYADYDKQYLVGKRIIIAATDDKALNRQIHADAQALNIPINVVDTPELCDFIFPAIVDRNPIVIGISSNGKAPVLARLLRARLESLIPQGYGKLASLAGDFRQQVKAKIPTLTARRQFWERAFEGKVSELIFAGKESQAKAQLEADLEHASTAYAQSHQAKSGQKPKQKPKQQDKQQFKQQTVGEVYLVGAGVGDPELLTFKALRLMQQADIVFYDALVSPQVLDLCRRDADKVYVGKKRSNHAVAQQGINELLIQHAKAGKRVVRLKGGDPFIFGRGGEEIQALRQANVAYQVVPGITAANAAASYAGIPLTHRDHAQSVRFVTGFLKAGKENNGFDNLLAPNETVVFYMGLNALERLTQGLIKAGKPADTPIAIISNASLPNQQVLTGTLENIVQKQTVANLPTPALLIMGEVACLHDELAWFGESPASQDNLVDEQDMLIAYPNATPQVAHALNMVTVMEELAEG
ncbi:uroporphyrinogen-III C-methyltransferase [Psychrobacter sp. I-STPA6b]|uniref:uroporphyrinogen-III C-methyltransferase n=1 Tax=Psychrobacter sp. I-STPA6b TaxID=2585718 RepID=UPI001D0C0C16|nr:uroporphyrinogen-III C-methyltransferase [Psychrobacter sp. I-STPA6b]